MNKKRNFAKMALLGVLLCGLASPTFVGCKDYDDDIENLETKVEEIANSLKDLQAKVGDGIVKSVTYDEATGRLTVVSTSGTVTYSTHQTIPTYSVELRNNELFVNNESKGKVSIDVPKVEVIDGKLYIDEIAQDLNIGTSTKVEVKDDGILYIDDEPTNLIVRPEVKVEGGKLWIGTQSYDLGLPNDAIAFVKNDKGVITGVTITLGDESASFKVQEATYVTSLTYIPTNYDPVVDNVAFLPVVVTDGDSEEARVYEYNLANKKLWSNMAYGWVKMQYHVNPDGVPFENFEVVGLKRQDVTVLSRAVTPTLDEVTEKDYVQGILTIRANAQDFAIANNTDGYDDPSVENPREEDDALATVNQVALQLKNTKENNGIVTSDYVSVKRMVLLQENILIGLNKDADQKKLVRGEFNDLAQLYKMAEVDKDAYVANIPVHLNVQFQSGIDLKPLIEGYTNFTYTNTGVDLKFNQELLTTFGFEPTYTYTVESYDLAEVDQTKYIDSESLKNGVIKFDQANTAAIGRNPVIRVNMSLDGGKTIIMTKLLKINVLKELQTDETFIIDDLENFTASCKNIEQYIDFDQIFNHCLYSKDQFVEAYRGNDKWSLFKFNEKTSKWDNITTLVDADNSFVVLGAEDHSTILGTALDRNNRATIQMANTMKEGRYKLQLYFEANNTSVVYKTLTVEDEFIISQPTVYANINRTYWINNNAQFNVQAPNTGYTPDEGIFDKNLNEFFVTDASNGKAVLNYTPERADYTCATAKFIFSTDASDKATVVDGNGKKATVIVTNDQITKGGEVIATIVDDRIVLTPSLATQELLNTGKFTINNVYLVVTLPNGELIAKDFNIDIVRPLNINPLASKAFTDAQDLGDEIDLDEILSMYDWRGASYVVTFPGDGVTPTTPENLGKFYDVKNISADNLPFVTTPIEGATNEYLLTNKEILTNLADDGQGNWVPNSSLTVDKASVTLPVGTNLTLKKSGDKWVLNYKTNMGTIISTYKMWIPVKVAYKWGFVIGQVEVEVNPVNN